MLERMNRRLRYFTVSPRLPNHPQLHKQLFVKFGLIYVASVLPLVVTHTVLMLSGFSYADARYWAALTLFGQNLLLFRYSFRFSLRNSAELSLGTVIFAIAPVTPLAVFVPHIGIIMFTVAVFTGLRPFSDGPEPGGWQPLSEQMLKDARRAEANRLKGRNE